MNKNKKGTTKTKWHENKYLSLFIIALLAPVTLSPFSLSKGISSLLLNLSKSIMLEMTNL